MGKLKHEKRKKKKKYTKLEFSLMEKFLNLNFERKKKKKNHLTVILPKVSTEYWFKKI